VNDFPIRPALVLLALVVGVWLAFGARAVLLQDDADAVLARARAGDASPNQVNSALQDYAKAGRLSPDQTPLIHQGELLYAAGRPAEAEAVARRAVDSEPDNLQAWFLTWTIAKPKTAEKRHAEKRVLELNPWFDYALRRARAGLP
jgi:tetratricopeptide (TPR) repeat protein